MIAVEAIAGIKPHPIDLDRVPGATFCHPQVGSVGMTEAQAKEAGHKVKVGKFKLGGVGAAQVYEDRDGRSRSSPTPSTARSSAPTSSATPRAT